MPLCGRGKETDMHPMTVLPDHIGHAPVGLAAQAVDKDGLDWFQRSLRDILVVKGVKRSEEATELARTIRPLRAVSLWYVLHDSTEPVGALKIFMETSPS
jgi:hypothetical protein